MIVNISNCNISEKRYHKLMKQLRNEKIYDGRASYHTSINRYVLSLASESAIMDLKLDHENIPCCSVVILYEFGCKKDIYAKCLELINYIISYRTDVDLFILTQMKGFKS